MNKRLKNIPIL